MTHRHHSAREWITLRQELVINATLDGMDAADVGALAHLADMARESRRLPPAARRVVMSAALEFATDEEAAAVYPPLPTTTTETTPPQALTGDDAIRAIVQRLGCPLLDYDPTPVPSLHRVGTATVTGDDAYRLSQGLTVGLGITPEYVDIGCHVEVPGVGCVRVVGRKAIGSALVLTWAP